MQLPVEAPALTHRINGVVQIAYFIPYSAADEKQRKLKIKADFKPISLLKMGLGVHQYYVDGPVGGGFYASLERTWNPQWSINFNAEITGNGDECCTPEAMKRISHYRLMLQPDFRYYPKEVLKGFFIGSGLGIVGGYGKEKNFFVNNKQERKMFSEAVLDVKLGWQSHFSPNYWGSTFFAIGLAGDVFNEDLAPFFRSGVLIGIKN